MKNIKYLFLLCIGIVLCFSSCKKTDDADQPVLMGTYEFSSNDNFDVIKWGEGGAQVALTDSELNLYIRPNWNLFPEKFKYVFTSDYKMILTDSNGTYLDTIAYKIDNNIVYLDIKALELGIDYLPMFKVSGTNLYNTFKGISYTINGVQNANSMAEFEYTNLVDSALNDFGYSSLTQLKANEEITTFQFRINYVKK